MVNSGKTPIMGVAQCTAAQMKKFLLKVNSAPKITCCVDQLVQLYLGIGATEDIRGDIAFAQAIKETGYFRFGGQVLPEQNNYAGLGAVNNDGVGKGARFASPELGVRAHIQHLKAYASTKPLKTPLVDTRFDLVTRGVAPNWEDLNGKWAVPGTNYGQQIVAIWREMLTMVVDESQCPFQDIGGRWSEGYIKHLWSKGLLAKADQFRPTDAITREEVAALLARLLESIK